MLAELVLVVYILSRSRLTIGTRILFSLLVLFVLQGITRDIENYNAKPIHLEEIPVGSFLTYSYGRILDQNLINPLVPLRLIGERYIHFALVVDNNNRKDVLEWRFYKKKEFEPYLVGTAVIGHIFSIPIETYFQVMNADKMTYRVFLPPKELPLRFSKEVVEHFANQRLVCTQFAFQYVNKALKRNLSSPTIPSLCSRELRRKGWREEYYIYNG
jgi:hypothetical protein